MNLHLFSGAGPRLSAAQEHKEAPMWGGQGKGGGGGRRPVAGPGRGLKLASRPNTNPQPSWPYMGFLELHQRLRLSLG